MSVCSICQRLDRSTVDDVLLSGVSVRQVAARFNLSKSAIGRHRLNCLAPQVQAAARIVAPASEINTGVKRARAIATGNAMPSHVDVLSLAGLLDRLARSLERLEGAASDAADNSLFMPLAAVSGQLHRGIEAAAKLQGLGETSAEAKAPFSINIVLPEGFAPPEPADRWPHAIDKPPT